MSWSSRAIRARSSATAMRAAASRSRSATAPRVPRPPRPARALAQREAGDPDDREEDRDEDELARRVAGVVVDDDRHAAERRSRGRATPASRRAGCRAGRRPPGRRRRCWSRTRQRARRRTRSPLPRARRTRAPRTGSGGGRGAAATSDCDRGNREPVRRVGGASGGERPRARLDRREHDQRVEPVPPCECPEPRHALNVLHRPRDASYLSRRPNRRLVRARIRPPDDDPAPSQCSPRRRQSRQAKGEHGHVQVATTSRPGWAAGAPTTGRRRRSGGSRSSSSPSPSAASSGRRPSTRTSRGPASPAAWTRSSTPGSSSPPARASSIQSDSLHGQRPRVHGRDRRRRRRIETLDAVQNVAVAARPGNAGQIAKSGHAALVEFEIRGDPDKAVDKVGPVLDRVDEVQQTHPQFFVGEFGDASSAGRRRDRLRDDLAKAGCSRSRSRWSSS